MSFKKPFRSTPVRRGPRYRGWKPIQPPRRISPGLAATLLGLAVFIIGMVVTNWNTVATAASPVVGRITGSNFAICVTEVRWNCVVDGDTFWRNGRKIRIADIDTPEVFSPQCPSEYERGMQATNRLRELLNEGPFELVLVGDRDHDKYGRDLRVVVRNGRSIGNQLVSEGLARTWTGRREPWC